MSAVKPLNTLNSSARLKINEIFYSIQGEANTVGLPTVFIRLTGCPLRCRYCDTEYAFTAGEWLSYTEIFAAVDRYNPTYVTVTGGEPLAQPNCLEFITQLADRGYRVSLETSGAIDIAQVDARVVKVVDIKTPGSGEQQRNRWENLEHINPQDQLKIVITDEDDYQWCKQILQQHKLAARCEVLLSPSYGQLESKQLAEWILRDRLPVRFQVQLHKYLWGDTPGH